MKDIINEIDLSNIANKIRFLRLKNGLSQKEVADKLDMSPSAYGYYEQDKRKMKLELLIKIAAIHNVPVDYFTGEYNEEGLRKAFVKVNQDEPTKNENNISDDITPMDKKDNNTYHNKSEIPKKSLLNNLKNLIFYANKMKDPDLSDEQLDILFDFIIEMIKYKLYDFKTNKYL